MEYDSQRVGRWGRGTERAWLTGTGEQLYMMNISNVPQQNRINKDGWQLIKYFKTASREDSECSKHKQMING